METVQRYYSAKVVLTVLECAQDGGQLRATGHFIKTPTGTKHEHKCTVCKLVHMTDQQHPIVGYIPDVEILYEDLKQGKLTNKTIIKTNGASETDK